MLGMESTIWHASKHTVKDFSATKNGTGYFCYNTVFIFKIQPCLLPL